MSFLIIHSGCNEQDVDFESDPSKALIRPDDETNFFQHKNYTSFIMITSQQNNTSFLGGNLCHLVIGDTSNQQLLLYFTETPADTSSDLFKLSNTIVMQI